MDEETKWAGHWESNIASKSSCRQIHRTQYSYGPLQARMDKGLIVHQPSLTWRSCFACLHTCTRRKERHLDLITKVGMRYTPARRTDGCVLPGNTSASRNRTSKQHRNKSKQEQGVLDGRQIYTIYDSGLGGGGYQSYMC
jgi:hypothetical protein